MSSLASSTPIANLPSASAPSAEFELLLACSIPGSGDAVQRDFQPLIEGTLDWQNVLQRADHHGVAPALYPALRNSARLPPPVLDQLRERYEQNARKNLKFTAELFRILDCLETHSITAIPIKGPVLAESVFGDLAQRDFSDLDVLVRVEDVLRAKRALRTLDYKPNTQFSEAEENAYLATGYEYTFDGPAGRNLLEVQWDVLPRFYSVDFDCAQFFERATSAGLAGRTVRTLCPTDLLLTLCVHAAKHAWARLCWLRDIAGVIQSQPIDWAMVSSRAQELGISRIVGISLLLAHHMLGARIPDPGQQIWIRDPEVKRLAERIQGALSRAEESSTESLDYFWLMLRARERRRDRARFLYRLALTPSIGEWSAVRLPARLFPLYRIVRLLRLMGRLGGFHGKSPR